ncbi:MAG TPA: hypothetical protein VM406_06655 [Noviherbaspirillum sp.]|nr:hypothetical protein [Noviherbaspirillum sp.]
MAATLFARRFVFLVFLLAALQLSGCAGVQRGWDAALLLADLQAAGGDSMLKRRTPAPHVTPLQYTIAGHAQVADRYAGPDASRGTLVLIHGFTEAGRRDVRMVQFAESLARSGFVVLAPELPGMTDMSVGSAEREEIATALRHATGHGRAGLVALSLAAGPAIHAAMKPDLADRVAYILLIGGYHDIVDVIRYATTGVDAATGETADLREPVQQGKWMLLRAQLRNLEDPQDHAALEAIANARTQDPAAPVD